ncbi:wolframin isoform X2 [Helicoverpa armigera]|uniref:wolframin isoform X2 n=1 Tax=Helicoverpa armigera TaxID=29058 RepID=UPI000B396648|nr:wolframin isoform X2 [Helicoverpa armigera]
MPVGRKRWNLHGPQGSLRRLRNQLAEDGCAESQVVLAKQLLEEKCELEADKISNFKQALEWLICATEQAHPEARRMLRRCIRSGVIDEDSAAIVRAKSCLAASRQETVARKAARDLFASLSNGEQYITTAQLERRIREICSTTLSKEPDDSDSPDDDSPEEARARALDDGHALEPSHLQAGDQVHINGTMRTADTTDEELPERCAPNEEIRNLTVDNLVSAAVDYCQGELPLVSYELTLTDPSVKALDHIPLLHQAFLHPIVFLQVLYLKLLYYFGNFTFRLTNIQLSLLLIAYLSVSADSLYHLVPLALYYASFVAMVICTFKMLHAKRQFIDFRKWSGLFLRYSDGNLQPDESENLFVRNNLGPFIQFFSALFINLFLYPFIATQWVPFSEFCVLSFFLMFLTLLSFGTSAGSPYPDLLALLSFAINVLAKYPYEKDTVVHQGWRFLDLHVSNYPSYILGNSIEFCLNARVFFSLLIPVILVGMARRSGWQGCFKYALPHCVTLSWLQMFITCSHGCTTYGLIRGTFTLVCSFLFLPLIGVLTVTLPIFAFLQYITMSRVFYTVSVVVGLGLSFGITCLLAKSESTKKFVTPFQLTIGIITLVYLGNQFVVNVQDDGLPSGLIELIGDDKASIKNLLKNEFITDYEDNTYHINWDDYYNQCNTPSWSDYNMAATQIKCAILDGANVNWEGYVKDVQLKNVRNRWRDFIAWLPGFLQEYFRCYYGEEYSTLCQREESLQSAKECEFVRSVARQSGKSCHLNNLNEYTYEIKLIMEASGGLLKRHSEISIVFDHCFSNFTRMLRADDKIRFKGVLSNDNVPYNIGTKDVNIRGYEIQCLECKEASGTVRSKAPSVSKFTELCKTIANDCVVSTKYILNFLLNPVVVFK